MDTPAEQASKLHAFNASLLQHDPELAEVEVATTEAAEVNRQPEEAIALESIIMRRRRPVLAIQRGAAVLKFEDTNDIPLWKARLEGAASVLGDVIPAVGRIELTGHPDLSWVGTGWLVHPRYLVTNRHVAEVFARDAGDRFVMQPGLDGDMTASIDLLQEIGRIEKQFFHVKGVSYIESRTGLDLAFLEVEQIAGTIAKPISLSGVKPLKNPSVATIGYPAFDSRIPEPDLMRRIYGDVFDKKRLAPGAITDVDQNRVSHNCATLGGNSGSVVVDLKSGDALGLHFSGSFLRTNFAVRADRVKERLDALLAGTLGRGEARRQSRPLGRSAPAARSVEPSAGPTTDSRGQAASIAIPLIVTISVGGGVPMVVSTRARLTATSAGLVDADEIDDPVEVEAPARPEDYKNRKGYVPGFLGNEFAVQLPKIVKGKSDILTWGDEKTVLPYEHFSIVMNARRRQCFYSACNINGARSKSSKRTAWRFDPRIPKEMQIMKECYGNTPKFSRGHMTRREDPAWGATAAVIQRGADDSMHVTNATPQMQSFNAPIWLALEDYALQHTREDDQKISVFTGPYFSRNDPTMYGVRIPVKFWKVIVFVNDETGELCATGYEMSQEDNLEPPEFVFGDFVSPQLNVSTQVPISMIEVRAGLSFDGLAAVDPLSSEEFGGPAGPLLHPEQIRFL
jgi:endonuclease G